VNVIANLIKVWFREMPEALFEGIPEPKMMQIASTTDLGKVKHVGKRMHVVLILTTAVLSCSEGRRGDGRAAGGAPRPDLLAAGPHGTHSHE
jgi:hypothetical protein